MALRHLLSHRAAGSLAIVLLLTGCDAGTAARAVRPRAPSGARAASDRDLVVDWPAHARAELEVALKARQVLLFRQDPEGAVHLLPTCRVWADIEWDTAGRMGRDVAFGYQAQTFSPKSEVIELRDADAISAKLPQAAGAVLTRFDAELKRGARLELALVSRQQLQAAGETVYRSRIGERSGLNGAETSPVCQSATHYARGITLGAFAMDTNASANVRSAAEIFGAGAAAASDSSRRVALRDGDLAACDGKDSSRCAVPLRVELAPIDPRNHRAVACAEKRPAACVEILRNTMAAAAPRSAASLDEARTAFAALRALCADADRVGSVGAQLTACEALVAHRASLEQYLSWTMPAAELERAAKLGCNVGFEASCWRMADAADARGDVEGAARFHQESCRHAVFVRTDHGCTAALQYAKEHHRKKDEALATAFAFTCVHVAELCTEYAAYAGPIGTSLATEIHPEASNIIAACTEGSAPSECRHAAALLAFGLGVPRDPAASRAAWKRQCDSVTKTGATCAKYPYEPRAGR